MELPSLNKNTINLSILLSLALLLTAIIRLNYPLLKETSSLSLSSFKTSSFNANDPNTIEMSEEEEKCDISTGEWVPDPGAPYYTNDTCWAIHEHQNCMKYGRPDSDYLKWRWKPNGCELPDFDPVRFLEMVRGKSMAFVGDSVGRNHMQSMICLLSKVEHPIDVSPTSDERFKRWNYANYNFTLASFWSPFLVRSEERRDSDGPTHTGLFNLFLDEPDDSWSTQIDDFDFLILNAGLWFTRTAVYQERRRVVGCRFCLLPNITDLPLTYGSRRAYRTAFRAINAREKYGGVTIVRTLAPSHFEGGLWNEGGNCVRRRPFRSNETVMEGTNLDLHASELEEFRVAEREGRKKWGLMDTTQAMLLRPDGHPSRYGHWPEENVILYNDCVHWCLPGPIDNWAQFLQHIIKIEARKNLKEKLARIQPQKKME